MGDCIDVNVPEVDETAIECCGITPTNCVAASAPDAFLNIIKGDSLTEIITKISEYLNDFSHLLNFKSFTCNVSQAGALAPTSAGLINTTGVTPTFAYSVPGLYFLNFPSPILSLTDTFLIMPSPAPLVYQVDIKVTTTSQVQIRVYDAVTGIPTDGLLSNTTLEIRIPN